MKDVIKEVKKKIKETEGMLRKTKSPVIIAVYQSDISTLKWVLTLLENAVEGEDK